MSMKDDSIEMQDMEIISFSNSNINHFPCFPNSPSFLILCFFSLTLFGQFNFKFVKGKKHCLNQFHISRAFRLRTKYRHFTSECVCACRPISVETCVGMCAHFQSFKCVISVCPHKRCGECGWRVLQCL